MSRLATSFVLGYHGCSKAVGERILSGETNLIESDKEYDWLGPGAYFWENDALRAMEWAEGKVSQGRYKEPFVVGAVIDLGNCLDLLVREDISLLQLAYADLEAQRNTTNSEMPRNGDLPHDAHKDKLLRKLDCAVIRNLHEIIASTPEGAPDRFEPFDTVRGLFTEGAPVYPGAGFYELTHTQIAVRTSKSIKGLFRPRSLGVDSSADLESAQGSMSPDIRNPKTVTLGRLKIIL